MLSSPIIRERNKNKPYWLRQECKKKRVRKAAVKTYSDEEIKPEEAIFCRACGGVITARREGIEVAGNHTHTFFNPAGIVYELGCFRKAEGCIVSGEPTGEFSWFAGHVWSYAFCRSCHNHLGWFYEGNGSTFFGLILPRLQG